MISLGWLIEQASVKGTALLSACEILYGHMLTWTDSLFSYMLAACLKDILSSKIVFQVC